MNTKKITVGIVGYGNLGKGVEQALLQCEDMELVAVFVRRNPEEVIVKSEVPVISYSQIKEWVGKIDIMIMCGGSAKDLPSQVPEVAKFFNTVDSFDTHAKIPEYFSKLNVINKEYKTCSLISVGWDPGLFSLMRALGKAILPNGTNYTFWGRGVSQGHSDAVRRLDGVVKAVQYTIPKEEAVKKVLSGELPNLETRDKHLREVYVVAEANTDLDEIETEIKTMPNYFAEYDTIVHFITPEEFEEKHKKMPHGGKVIYTGKTACNKQLISFELNLEDNPGFTGAVLVSCARALDKIIKRGEIGAKSIYDLSIADLLSIPYEELLKNYL